MSLEREIAEHILSTYLPGTSVDELDPSLDLFESGVVSSLQLLELIEWLRSRYGIPVEELEMSPRSFRSVAAIREFVENAQKVS
ncbi:acyl carrier protein [Streptomyces sp. NPDC001848]|uniref:acyl carrier protein n=1 Tax=Streptomyces sp. NPDC001848 TaxID=3364618 RepID=UPI0036B0FB12